MTIDTNVVPAPWQFWPEKNKLMFKVSAYLLTVMFWSLQIAHAEEVRPASAISLLCSLITRTTPSSVPAPSLSRASRLCKSAGVLGPSRESKGEPLTDDRPT